MVDEPRTDHGARARAAESPSDKFARVVLQDSELKKEFLQLSEMYRIPIYTQPGKLEADAANFTERMENSDLVGMQFYFVVLGFMAKSKFMPKLTVDMNALPEAEKDTLGIEAKDETFSGAELAKPNEKTEAAIEVFAAKYGEKFPKIIAATRQVLAEEQQASRSGRFNA